MHFILPSKNPEILILETNTASRVLDKGWGIYSVTDSLIAVSFIYSLIYSSILQVFTVFTTYVYRSSAGDRDPDHPLTQVPTEPAREPLRSAPRGLILPLSLSLHLPY